MANLFGNFLKGLFSSDGYMRDFQHASRLYRDENFYDYAPKAGWLYYVRLQLNSGVVDFLDPTWNQRYSKFVGILAKQVDLPRFRISTDTLNQYNKKTVVQTKINYEPLNIVFHDDMANATTDLWRNYFQYYYSDGNYGVTSVSKNSVLLPQFEPRTRLVPDEVYPYGLANGHNERFFTSIEIYLLNKKNFMSFSLVNPIIKEWSHEQVNQNDNRFLESRMQVEFETVYYNKGKSRGIGFADQFYDKTFSPNKFSTLGGVVDGAIDIFGENGSFASAQSPLDFARAGLEAAALVKNASKIGQNQFIAAGYSAAGGLLTSMIGGGSAPSPSSNPNALANTFRYQNDSVDRLIAASAKPVTQTQGLEFATRRSIQAAIPPTATSTPQARPIQPTTPTTPNVNFNANR